MLTVLEMGTVTTIIRTGFESIIVELIDRVKRFMTGFDEEWIIL